MATDKAWVKGGDVSNEGRNQARDRDRFGGDQNPLVARNVCVGMCVAGKGSM